MSLHRYEIAVLKTLESHKSLSIDGLIEASKIGRDEVLWALETLSKENAVEVKRVIKKEAELTEEGKSYAKDHLPEIILIHKIAKEKVNVKDLSSPEERIGLQWARSRQFVEIKDGALFLTQKGKFALDEEIKEELVLKELYDKPESYAGISTKYNNEILSLIKRKLLNVSTRSEIENVSITEHGAKLLLEESSGAELVDALNKKMITNKEWTDKSFKRYAIDVKVEREFAAKLHPLREMIEKLKKEYTNMGFKEVAGPVVVPAFWTFDSLFMPQDHPARDMQDTFYLSNPEEIDIGNKKLVSQVKASHESSWHSDWLEKVAMQGVLRTQTTSVSVRELYNLGAYKDYRLPLKIFTIGRTFRNENPDYSHLTDFYQMDGMIIGENLTLANLFDTLIRLYKSTGLEIRFKPTYFPFVEPGVEVQTYLKKTGKWFELLGAGILRREISGIARKNITVLAWGGGVERIMLAKGYIQNLPELYNQGIGWTRNRRIL